MRGPEVVVVAEREPVTPRHFRTVIASGTHPCGAVVTDKTDPLVSERRYDRADIVGRAVVNDDYLEVHATLTEDAAQRELEKVSAVVGRDDRGDFRRHGGNPTDGAAAAMPYPPALWPE